MNEQKPVKKGSAEEALQSLLRELREEKSRVAPSTADKPASTQTQQPSTSTKAQPQAPAHTPSPVPTHTPVSAPNDPLQQSAPKPVAPQTRVVATPTPDGSNVQQILESRPSVQKAAEPSPEPIAPIAKAAERAKGSVEGLSAPIDFTANQAREPAKDPHSKLVVASRKKTPLFGTGAKLGLLAIIGIGIYWISAPYIENLSRERDEPVVGRTPLKPIDDSVANGTIAPEQQQSEVQQSETVVVTRQNEEPLRVQQPAPEPKIQQQAPQTSDTSPEATDETATENNADVVQKPVQVEAITVDETPAVVETQQEAPTRVVRDVLTGAQNGSATAVQAPAEPLEATPITVTEPTTPVIALEDVPLPKPAENRPSSAPAAPETIDDIIVKPSLNAAPPAQETNTPATETTTNAQQPAEQNEPTAEQAETEVAAIDTISDAPLPLPEGVEPIKVEADSSSLSASDAKRLFERGKNLLENGQIEPARLLLKRVMDAGYKEGARYMARTFDPIYLATVPSIKAKGDATQAQIYYDAMRNLNKNLDG